MNKLNSKAWKLTLILLNTTKDNLNACGDSN